MCKRWFISDLHFGHYNIIRYNSRPFENTEAMDTHMINTWNKYISDKDAVYIVGDLSFANFQRTKEIVQQLKGRKILIRGNHDEFTAEQYVEMGFHEIKDIALVSLSNAEQVLLCHYPYISPWYRRFWSRYILRRRQVKYYELYPRDCGRFLIHGHHHKGEVVKDKMINVCVDLHKFKPLSESDICKIINEVKYETYKKGWYNPFRLRKSLDRVSRRSRSAVRRYFKSRLWVSGSTPPSE